MSQIILDDQLFELEVLAPIARWTTVQRLRELRANEVSKDARVPALLRELSQPSFVTIDMGCWDRSLAHARYWILCFPLRNDEQRRLPELLRRLFSFAGVSHQGGKNGKGSAGQRCACGILAGRRHEPARAVVVVDWR